jgi:hypothetical protein
MLKHLKIETVYGLIDLVDAQRQVARLSPKPDVVRYRDHLKEHLFPSTPSAKAERTLEIGIVNIVKGLSREQKIELVALMWLGRERGSWDHWLEKGRSDVDDPNANMPRYVTDKSDLDEYLDDGLEQLCLPRRKELHPA